MQTVGFCHAGYIYIYMCIYIYIYLYIHSISVYCISYNIIPISGHSSSKNDDELFWVGVSQCHKETVPLVGGLEHCLRFHIGNNNPNWLNWLIFFQRGWNHQPVIHYVYNFLKRNIPRITNSALTVDKPWKDLPRAWNDLSRAWTGVPDFLTNVSFFCYSKVLDSPKMRNSLGFNLDTLDGTRIQKHTVLKHSRASISLVLIQVFVALRA